MAKLFSLFLILFLAAANPAFSGTSGVGTGSGGVGAGASSGTGGVGSGHWTGG